MKIDIFKDQVIHEYRSGEYLSTLGSKYGCNPETVTRRLIEWGVSLRHHGWWSKGKKKTEDHRAKLRENLNRVRPLAIKARWMDGRSAKGQNNPKWKGGKTNYFKQEVLSRDGRVCKLCGYKDHPEIIEVHHIDGNHHNNDIKNGIAVCPNCHRIEEFKNGTFHTKLREKRYA